MTKIIDFVRNIYYSGWTGESLGFIHQSPELDIAEFEGKIRLLITKSEKPVTEVFLTKEGLNSFIKTLQSFQN